MIMSFVALRQTREHSTEEHSNVFLAFSLKWQGELCVCVSVCERAHVYEAY